MNKTNVEVKAERILKSSDAPFIDARNQSFPCTFSDNDGVKFSAKADYFLPHENKYIEVKGCKLNNAASTYDSFKKLCYHICTRLRLLTFEDVLDMDLDYMALARMLYKRNKKACLDSAWNYSLEKHRIVSNTLKKHSIGYEMWFFCKLSKQAINKLERANIAYKVC